MRKPVILIIENSVDVTGALKSIVRIAHDLQPFFDFVFVIPTKSKGRFWIEKFGFHKIHELRMLELSKRMFSLIFYVPFLLVNSLLLVRIIKRERVTLIHSNDLYNMLPVMIRMMGNRTPYVCHIRFMPDHFPPWIFNFWMKRHICYAENIVAVSNSVVKLLPKHPKISMIYGELPDKEIHPNEVSKKPYFVFLYLSNFMTGKGQDFALEAFARIHRAIPDWRLRFVGSDMGLEKNRDYHAKLVEQSKKLGVAEKIEWLGFTNDVEWEYKDADIVLNFSESESFSSTCLEALFFGRPLIASNCGGPSEIIDHGVTGTLVENKNVAAMGLAMEELAIQIDKRKAMSVAARNVVRQRFSVENTSFRLKEIFTSALERSK